MTDGPSPNSDLRDELNALHKELRASRARLEATIDSSLDAIVTTDSESVILEWSRHAETMFGWSHAEAIGRTLSETIIPARYREAHGRGIRRYLSTGEGPILGQRVEISALHRDGREFPVELTVAPAGFGDHLVFNAFIRDLTERNRLNRLRTAQHAATRVLADFSTFPDVGPRLLEAIGTALEWEIGSVWLLDSEGQSLRCAAVWQSPSLDSPEFVEETRRLILTRGVGLPGKVWEEQRAAWVTDLGDESRFPRAGVAAKKGIRGGVGFPIVAGSSFVGVVEFFYREILQPDESLLASLDSIGREIAQALKRLDAERERDLALADVLKQAADLEMRADELQQQATALQDLQVELEASVENLQSTNEQLLIERQGADAARAVAENANAAKTAFLANMSHELRTPINAIMGYADLLEMGITGPVSPEQRAQLHRIQNASRHLLTLIEDVLDLSKIEAGRVVVAREVVDLDTLVDAALQMVHPQAIAKELTLEKRGAPAPPLIGDGSRVKQILVNLLSNAVKFTEVGGEVTLTSVFCADGEDGLHTPGPCVRLDVRDSGIGIPSEQRESIFEPFFQVETDRTKATGGIGLGLAISREMARQMGGDVRLTSEVGRGSCFSLYLPAARRTDDQGTELRRPSVA